MELVKVSLTDVERLTGHSLLKNGLQQYIIGTVYNAKIEDTMCEWNAKMNNLLKRSFIPTDRIMRIRCSPAF